MLILVEDNLLHVDSSTDILEHYGVKGMKWGKRLRSAVESAKQAPKNIYNNHVENIKYSYRQDAVGTAGAVAAGHHIENKDIRKSDTSYQRKYKTTK